MAGILNHQQRTYKAKKPKICTKKPKICVAEFCGNPQHQPIAFHAIILSIFKICVCAPPAPMSVLILTIFVSMMLAAFFVGAFLYHHDYSGGDSMRDSILPFKKEKSRANKGEALLKPESAHPSAKPDPTQS
jgi:hypothetical protein